MECPNDLNAMADLAKVADIVMLLIDALDLLASTMEQIFDAAVRVDANERGGEGVERHAGDPAAKVCAAEAVEQLLDLAEAAYAVALGRTT